MRRWLRMTLRLWEQAKNEHSSPREIGWAVAIGVFSGCTPFVGLHMWVALALATLFRLNRLWSFLGSRISFTPLLAAIAFCEIESAHRLRTGSWVPLAPHEALNHGRELLSDWLLGTGIVGTAFASVVGVAAYFAAGLWRRARTAHVIVDVVGSRSDG